ncbi:CRISPR-associated helicase Cas3' [Actinacidiphila sp. ITFR-21]|uniref:CRISPR-associated helicase Cas3' n=1 Tax=Actinacidiphila sp. ITFR-21 TaxID=3075199 RepID=UPI00288A17B3|nr:CRISPR-associated helicase Cas3' [Streptomyces sp. ITFR-21]WNI18724.1 CRISPR-associated helicase Cas3' [Streptomyces sp. ITFR-21]
MMSGAGGAWPVGRVDCRMWGKKKGLPRVYPVVCHMLDTAAVFLALWDGLVGEGTRERVGGALGLGAAEARAVLSFWAGLHDLGKITPPFQAQVPAAFAGVRAEEVYWFVPGADKEWQFRHERGTHWALASLFAEAGYPGGGGRSLRGAVSHQIAQLLGGHHGRYGDVLKARELARASEYQAGLGEGGWARQRRAHFAELRRVTGGDAVPEAGLPAELAVVVSGLVVVADWLASQTDAIVPLMPPADWQGTPGEIDAHWRRTRATAAGRVTGARLGRATFQADEFGAMFPFTPNALQRDLVGHLPELVAGRGTGLVLVTAPTGDGKTEAALFAASLLGRAAGARGLYFALPTMATANGMYPRVREFAENALTGERALTLLHSMAWLSPLYTGESGGGEETGGEISAAHTTALEAEAWLRGAKRGLLAPLGVGTIDQALAAVLPLTYNALRLFALSDKVFVVDEAHAYGPWMHKLLTILLEWLGAFRAPVVLLSATLSGRTAGSLVDAYRRGAGFLEPSAVEPCYPSWLFVDGATGEVSKPRATDSERARALEVTVRQVTWDIGDAPQTPPRTGGRRRALREALSPLAEDGGTALVCCTTVAEAQATYRDLCTGYPELAATEGGLRLLHSRYRADIRQRITDECQAAYGKSRTPEDASRPRSASILVATQVVEQSLDFDFDLIVSDLAPLAQLLQRAGRARRHARGPQGRPAWARSEDRPQLVVLEPVDAQGRTDRPRTWGSVYDAGLLTRTAGLLHATPAAGIAVPGDVQELVDFVYAEDFVDLLDAASQRELRQMDSERQADEMVQEHLATMVGIDAPADVADDLHRLSRREAGVTEELLTTRLGADTGRLLCLYEQPDGKLTLDEDGKEGLPKDRAHGPSRAELAQIMTRVAPVPGKWLLGEGEAGLVPQSWEERSMLRDVVPLRMQPDGPGVWRGRHGGRTITISAVGLEVA